MADTEHTASRATSSEHSELPAIRAENLEIEDLQPAYDGQGNPDWAGLQDWLYRWVLLSLKKVCNKPAIKPSSLKIITGILSNINYLHRHAPKKASKGGKRGTASAFKQASDLLTDLEKTG